jgi:hypothetical protein
VRLVPVLFDNGEAQKKFLTNQATQAAQNAPGGSVKLTCTSATPAGATVTASQVIFPPVGPAKVSVHMKSATGGDTTVNVTAADAFTPSGDQKSETIAVTFMPPLQSGATYTLTVPFSPKRGGTAADDLSADATCMIP